MATHSSVLAWRIPGTGDPGGPPSMGSHRVGHNWSNLVAAAASTYTGEVSPRWRAQKARGKEGLIVVSAVGSLWFILLAGWLRGAPWDLTALLYHFYHGMFSQEGGQPSYSLEYEKLRASDLMFCCKLCKEVPDLIVQPLRGNFQGSPSVGNLLRGIFLEELSKGNLLRESSKGKLL